MSATAMEILTVREAVQQRRSLREYREERIPSSDIEKMTALTTNE